MRHAERAVREDLTMTALGIPRLAKRDDLPPAITLAKLIEVLSELTEDENEIVGTMLHMVERRSIRLIAV
jgi:hypothetical protein